MHRIGRSEGGKGRAGGSPPLARCLADTMSSPTGSVNASKPSVTPTSKRILLIRSEARALLLLGGPVIGAQLAQISMNTVDAVMAGWLSPRDLAAVAIGGNLWMSLFVFGMGILLSTAPTVAHSFGAGRFDEIGHQVRQGLWLSLAVAAGSFMLIRSAHPLLSLMHVDEDIIPVATGYLRAVSWGIPASCAFTVLRNFSEAVSMTRPVMLISVGGTFANIAGNYVFMHGHLGFPRLGAVGCGVATAIVIWLMLGCLVAWIVFEPYYRQFPVFTRFERPDFRTLRTLIRLGTPIGVSLFMEGSLFGAVALLLGRLGETVVAGHQIALNVASITFMVPLGIAIAITVRVGQAMGRNDPIGARLSGTVGAGLATAFMGVAALLIATFPRAIATLYTPNPGVQEMAVSLLYMAAVFQVFDGLQVAGAGALRGLKDSAVPMVLTFVAYWGLGLPLGYFLGISRGGGPQAIWIGLIAGLFVAALLLNIRFQRETIRRIKTAARIRATNAAADGAVTHNEQTNSIDLAAGTLP
jgi:multidrug resistance protein, MATE family